ncbi:MAG: hypothetical protein CFH10_00526 [Alphaproteobacteria bacterium MarineAlpha4_Bin2]|nr:MAG: hypothetical protein CFH10_00526 [Alphaproteobacteria bacterium MarineAlpha4_Bin2]
MEGPGEWASDLGVGAWGRAANGFAVYGNDYNRIGV